MGDRRPALEPTVLYHQRTHGVLLRAPFLVTAGVLRTDHQHLEVVHGDHGPRMGMLTSLTNAPNPEGHHPH